MTARAEQHPASIMLEAFLLAIKDAPLTEERLAEAAEYVAALVLENADLRVTCTSMAQTIASLEADAMAMEKLDTGRVGVITELKNRLAAVCVDVEHLYLGASMDLERHTDRFNAVRRIREQLDPALVTFTPDARFARAANGAH